MFGDRMRTIIEKEKLTSVKAAEMLGVSQPRLAQWLSGKNEPSHENIIKFCEIFHTTPNYLFGFDDDITEADRRLLLAFKEMAGGGIANRVPDRQDKTSENSQNLPEQTQNKER